MGSEPTGVLVVEGRAPDVLLDSYHDERHPVGRVLLRTTDRMFNVAATHNPLFIAARNFLAPRILPWFMRERSRRARAFRFISELGIKYPDSPVVGEELGGAGKAFRRGPAAGCRAPDGPLRTLGEERIVSLFSRMREVPHHLLLFGGRGDFGEEVSELLAGYGGEIQPHLIFAGDPDQVEPEIPAYVDETGTLRERYGLRATGYYLVRPDGYVAFRAPGTDLRPLRDYLQRIFLTTAPTEARKS